MDVYLSKVNRPIWDGYRFSKTVSVEFTIAGAIVVDIEDEDCSGEEVEEGF